MAFIITDQCTLCNLCVEPCPNEAISEGEEMYFIDPARCTECIGFHNTPQCADVCPVDCCIVDTDRIESETTLIDRARKLHPGRQFPATDYPSRFKS